jgi:hypothetical protein
MLMRSPYVFFFLLAFFLFSRVGAFAVSPTQENEVVATVGSYVLNVSGYASPNASINLKVDNVLLSSAIAAGEGTFSFIKIPISKGTTGVCFDTVDVQRIGTSRGCISFPPAAGDITMQDIYLPPTIGLEKEEIDLGSSGLTYGYTMPNASINIKLTNGSSLKTSSSTTGRYSYTVSNLPIGSYKLAAKGIYQGTDSLDPATGVTLRVLTSSASITNEAVGLRRNLLMIGLWLLIGTLILGPLIIYLIRKYKPEWLEFIVKSRFYAYLVKHLKRKLHHAWFVGY